MQVDWYRIRDVGSYRMPQVTVAVRHFDLPQMPFFGLGNDSSLDDRSLYKLTETELPILADFPLGSGLTLSAQLNTLFAASDPSSTFTSTFSQATAPGIDASTTHMVPGLAVTYRSPDALKRLFQRRPRELRGLPNAVGRSVHVRSGHSTDGGALRHRGEPFAQASFPYLRSLLGSSRFSVGANLVISEPRSHNAVPLYLQPTLGGGDIHNENWLSSYTNYRFTAPNTLALGVSYERRLFDPLGFSVFGQWGKVAQDLGDIDFDHLKYSVGVGLSIRLGGKALLELSFAWGGDEGSQTFATGNTNNAIGFGARAAGTVGLRGVF
jgi:hypothetical protein